MKRLVPYAAVALLMVFGVSGLIINGSFRLHLTHAQTPTYTCSAGQFVNSQLVNTGQSCGVPTAPIKAVTGSIGGSLISLGCANQTPITVAGATTSMACSMSGAGGTQPANVQPQCFVSAANTVTPQFCTSITLGLMPSAQTYNVTVF